MFNNIGGKIKGLAQFIAWVGIILSFISGIDVISSYSNFVGGLLVIVIGSILSWIGSFVLYGFGQLIENSDDMAEMIGVMFEEHRLNPNIKRSSNNSPSKKPVNNDTLNELQTYLDAGLITPEEFNDRASKL